MNHITETPHLSLLSSDPGHDLIEDRLRQNIRATIEALFEEELAEFIGRCRYGRDDSAKKGYRHGRRDRQITGTFGTETVSVPRARIEDEDGKVSEWRSKALPRYQRLTKKAEALIASVYLAGTNTRRVKRALHGLFQGAVSKDVVSRTWRKVKVDWVITRMGCLVRPQPGSIWDWSRSEITRAAACQCARSVSGSRGMSGPDDRRILRERRDQSVEDTIVHKAALKSRSKASRYGTAFERA